MATVTCPMCATPFDPADNAACGTCPLGSSCHLACCPACGYTTVDPASSRLAGWVTHALRHRPRRRRRHTGWAGLQAVPPGGRVRVTDLARLPHGKRRRLESLGLVVGEVVEVLTQTPVTVVRAGHSQLALAGELSRLIDVGPVLRT